MTRDNIKCQCVQAGARQLVEIIAPCLREEEQGEALAEFTRVLQATLDVFDFLCAGVDQRVPPQPC